MACNIMGTPAEECNKLNLSGVANIYMIEKEYVTFPLSASNKNVATIPKTSGKVFKKFNCNRKKSKFSATYEFDQVNRTGYRTCKVMAQLNNLRAELFEALETYETGVELVAVVEFKTGVKLIVGEDAAPLIMSKSDADSGTDEKGQINAINVELDVLNNAVYPYVYTGTIADLLA